MTLPPGHLSDFTPEELHYRRAESQPVARYLAETGGALGFALLGVFADSVESIWAGPNNHERRHPFVDNESYAFHKDSHVIAAVCAMLKSSNDAPNPGAALEEALDVIKSVFTVFFKEYLIPYFLRLFQSAHTAHIQGDPNPLEHDRRSAELDLDAQFSLLLLNPEVRVLLDVAALRARTWQVVGAIYRDDIPVIRHTDPSERERPLVCEVAFDDLDGLLFSHERIRSLFDSISLEYQAFALQAARNILKEPTLEGRRKITRKANDLLFAPGTGSGGLSAHNFLSEINSEAPILESIREGRTLAIKLESRG